jgi:hypothetical protein
MKNASFPIDVFVVFLHEFGHAVAAMITGGDVAQLVMFPDDPGVAGYACTGGGFRPLVLMGGYIGSALFGAAFLRLGMAKQCYSKALFRLVAICMVGSQILWFPHGSCSNVHAGVRDCVVSWLVCLVGGFIFWQLAEFPEKFRRFFLVFLGTASLIQIILDINVGPGGDLTGFTELFGGIVPFVVWQGLWFLIVLAIVFFTVRSAVKQGDND